MKTWILLSLLVLCSCATSINTAGPRFDTPEAMGGMKTFKGNVQAHSAHRIFLRENTTSTELSTQNPRIGYKTTWGAGLGMGLTKWLDLEWETMSLLKFKAQILGEHYKSQVGSGFSLAATAGGGVHGSAFELDSVFNNSDVTGLTSEGALIAGYRVSPEFLVYSGVFLGYRDYTVEQFQTVSNSDGTTRRELKDKQDGIILNRGANLGIETRFGKTNQGYALFEAAVMNTRAGYTRKTAAFGGVQLGFIY